MITEAVYSCMECVITEDQDSIETSNDTQRATVRISKSLMLSAIRVLSDSDKFSLLHDIEKSLKKDDS